MAKSHRLTRIANPSILRSIDPKLLTTFFRPHERWLASHGVKLAPVSDIDYDGLSMLLHGAAGDMPDEMFEAVVLVDDVSADRHEERLRKLAADLGIKDAANATNVDIAVRVAMIDRTALCDLHATTLGDRFRTVERFAALCNGQPTPARVTADMKARLEDLLNGVFEARGRDRSAVVFPIESPLGPRFLISRGDTLKRQSVVEAQRRHTLLMRPETFDMVCWDQENSDLLVRAQTKGDLRAYCQAFGMCLFDKKFIFDPDATPARFTLAPIREHGRASLSFASVDGIEAVNLEWIDVRRADYDDGKIRFEAPRAWELLELLGWPLPRLAEPFRMLLKVKMEGEKRERRVKIYPPCRIECEMDDTGVLITRLLKRNGFMLPRRGVPDDAELTLWDLP